MNPLSHPLHWKFQKNRHVLETLLLRNAPSFVLRRNEDVASGEIPVFTFHTFQPERFERQCRHLAENGYRALSADEFASALAGTHRPPERAVLLTVDDGLKSVWTVAFPLLRKYGLRATCFLIPGVIPDASAPPRPTLEDVWRGEAELDEVTAPSKGGEAVCSWDEIRAMQETGVVDFEAHTTYHALVFCSDRLFDFVGPDYDPYYYGNLYVPIVRRSGRDLVERTPLPGMPVFRSRPRMSTERRFFDDEEVREHCIATAASEGGDDFFRTPDWKKRLREIVQGARSARGGLGRFETPEERDDAVRDDLVTCRERIEARLTGKRVTQVCWPWYEAAEFAVDRAREAGYTTTYFGQRRGRSANRPGDDPLHVVRVDEMFVERLPGSGRRSLRRILSENYLGPPPAPATQRDAVA